MKLNTLKYLIITSFAVLSISCEDFLEKEPPSYIVPEDYYRSEDQLQAIANDFYGNLPSHGTGYDGYGMFDDDQGTDNQAGRTADGKYAKGQWKTGMNNDNWSWGTIRNVNYSLNTILERYHKKEISGSDRNIRHYIGELYFFRAYSYFGMLRNWGDLPIIKEAFLDDEAILVAANKRMPRNEVARFILSDLDNALLYMSDIDSRRNRLSPDVALLIKSRVALFEGSWLRHFKGTAWVPNGEGWPGKAKDYHANYKYPSGSIEQESDYFFTIAAESAQKTAEKYKSKLTPNSGNVPQNETDAENPYLKMFSSTDPSVFPDVLLWREYMEGLGLCNDIESSVQRANNGAGLTRGLVESFLMKDGKPIYASRDGFKYDDTTIQNIRTNADPRLHVFLKAPGQTNVFKNMDAQTDQAVPVEPAPRILDTDARKYTTGYTIRKGGSFDKAQCGGGHCTTATIGFRATEALLNYIEAQYMLTGDINSGHILEYWKTVRAAAGFTDESQNPATTIAATDMSQETLDWGAYSAGELLTDATLYNIRRERRCELLGESFRWMDLIRWRALDQLIQKPYFIEGFHLWNTPMQAWYNAEELIADGSSSATVSNVSQSEYLRPYQRNMTSNNLHRDGFTWTMAHYLQPMPLKQFLLTAPDHATMELSPLYQNPGWPMRANLPAEQ